MPATDVDTAVHERMTQMEARVDGTLTAMAQRLEGTAAFVRDLKKDVDDLRRGVDDVKALAIRMTAQEVSMDNLPARMTEMEKYGSKNVQGLPLELQKLHARLTELESQPKEQAAAESKRQNRLLVWAGIGGCLYMLVSTGVTILLGGVGIALSIYLAQHP